tara:strand:- start:58 stop:351 length:294 start_codon:yes stop_codon:yes gene_type:complete
MQVVEEVVELTTLILDLLMEDPLIYLLQHLLVLVLLMHHHTQAFLTSNVQRFSSDQVEVVLMVHLIQLVLEDLLEILVVLWAHILMELVVEVEVQVL